MSRIFASLAEFYAHGFDAVIDVRSPAEFAEDHVPGALSLPVLSDAERARVGTIYTQEAPFKARKVGAALVARNAAAHIEGPLADHDGSWRPLVYCWRGGQRSGSFASILTQIGWRAETVVGGYQSYRRLVAGMLHETALPHRIVLLDGNTGTAKTEILARLRARGAQVIDLEALAAHRGSVFGAVGRAQPAQKGFESALARALSACDPTRTTVLEAESSKIGEVMIPPSLWKAMRTAPRLTVTAPVAARARYLTSAYADVIADAAALEATLEQLVPFHGHDTVGRWTHMVRGGAFAELAEELVTQHYDPRYNKSRGAVASGDLISLDRLDDGALDQAADQILTKL